MPRSAAQSSQRYPLTQVLGTEANVRLLRELSLHGGQLSAPSLASRTALAKGSVRTGLNVLLGFGAVAVAGSGHAMLYALRPDYPLREAVVALFEAEQGRFDAILAAVRDAAETCGSVPTATYVYGSVARGQDKPGSDLDILVVAEDESRIPAMTGVMREALEEPSGRIGFLPSVIGLSLDAAARHMQDAQSPWREALQGAMVVSGIGPASLASLQTLKRRKAAE